MAIQKVALSGGGIKGLAFIGALKWIEELQSLQEIDTFAGSSSGAIFATLFVLGYSLLELENLLKYLDLSTINSMTPDSVFLFLDDLGLDTGEGLEKILKQVISKKAAPMVTFAELFSATEKHLIITVSCLNDGKAEYLDHFTAPGMPIYVALRMSCSLPIIFNPVRYLIKATSDNLKVGMKVKYLGEDNVYRSTMVSRIHSSNHKEKDCMCDLEEISEQDEYLSQSSRCIPRLGNNKKKEPEEGGLENIDLDRVRVEKLYVDGGLFDNLPISQFEPDAHTLGLQLDHIIPDNIDDFNNYYSLIIKYSIDEATTYKTYRYSEHLAKLLINANSIDFNLPQAKIEDMIQAGYDQLKNQTITRKNFVLHSLYQKHLESRSDTTTPSPV